MTDSTLSPAAERFSVLYRITVNDERSIKDHARDITLEQTVEIPGDCVPDEVAKAEIVGRIEKIDAVPGAAGRFDVTISYRTDITGYAVPQFLNVLYGNISIKKGIRITGLDLPESLLSAFGGPRFGVEGIRRLTGVWHRPLASTALKPIGLPVSELAAMCAACARGGLDIIKEDHGMADLHFHPFRERVARCHEAVVAANAETGRNTLYFPMVSGGFEQIADQFAYVKSLGVPGVLAAPALVGLDTVRALANRHGLAVMAHPAFTGTHFYSPEHGMTPAVLLGTLFRLLGADISVFPNYGGRFSFSQAECIELAEALRGPLGALKPALPAPAGGMKLDRIEPMAETFGRDTVLLIGGALLQYSRDLEKSASTFMQGIRKVFGDDPR